ncbi:MAG: hypothetical protein EKK41_10610 [Hyphomicrobiales bacterium]|nr:MAG: hypothetical protein EKK41_10610 [Hyphomicrobiales bacterium]
MTDKDPTAEITAFFTAIEPMLGGYGHQNFAYFAVKEGEGFVLAQGRLALAVTESTASFGVFANNTVRVGNCRLSDLKLDAKGLVESLRSGSLQTPHGRILVSPNLSATYIPFHNESFQAQHRVDVLALAGPERKRPLELTKINWELRGADTPYDGLGDILGEFGLGNLSEKETSIEIVAFNVAAVDGQSQVIGSKAQVAMLLAYGLPTEKAKLGYRVLSQGKVEKRASLTGSSLNWGERDGLRVGATELEVPEGAVLQCIASFDGRTQQHWWLHDPRNAPNPRRSIYQVFDNNLEILSSFFSTPHPKSGADDLESGVAWLMWMLGFSVAHLGNTPRTREAPDGIGVTPSGDVIVVECTIGLLKSENKLPKLVARAETVRNRLKTSGNGHLRVLPVIVSSLSRGELKADLEQAEKLGVGVLGREDLADAINRTLAFPNAQAIFDDGYKNVITAQAKHTGA